MIRSIRLVLIVCSGSIAATSNAYAIQPGQVAPAVQFEKVVQGAGAGTRPDLADGTPTVLDFWATWCAPCVPAHRHLDHLVRSLPTGSARLISITEEDEATVRRYLQKRPSSAWIVIDSDRSAFEAYGAKSLPTLVVIDGSGKVVLVTSDATRITKPLLSSLASPKTASGNKAAVNPAERAASGSTPLLELSLAEATGGSELRLSYNEKAGEYRAESTTLRWSLGRAYGVPEYHIIGPNDLLDAWWKLRFKVPADRAARFNVLLRDALALAFDIAISRESRVLPVLVLSSRSTPHGLHPSTAEREQISTDRGFILAKRMAVSALAAHLQSVVHKPVIDETGLTGHYDWDLEFPEPTERAVIEAVRSQLGLELTPETREVEVLVVRPKPRE